MKVKLLKKVRKRFSIIVVSEISNRNYNAFFQTDKYFERESLIKGKKIYGLPLTALYDKREVGGVESYGGVGTKQNLLDRMMEIVRNEYGHIKTKTNTHREKIWHTQKQHK